MAGTRKSPQLQKLKSFLSGTVAVTLTPESRIVLRKAAKFIAKVTSKKGTKAAASEVAKETAEEMVKQVTKETAEEVVGATAATTTSRLSSGAKAGFIGGAAVEGVCLTYTGIKSGIGWWNGEITGAEFRQHMVKRSGGACGSLAGGTIGGAVGTVLLPVPFLGTFVGSVVGGVVGDRLGSKCGEKLDNSLFKKKSTVHSCDMQSD